MKKVRPAQEIAEWGLIVALVSVVVIGSLSAIVPNIKSNLTTIVNALINAQDDMYASP